MNTTTELPKKTVAFNMKTDPEFLRMIHDLAKELGINASSLTHMAIRNLARDYRAGTLRIATDAQVRRAKTAQD